MFRALAVALGLAVSLSPAILPLQASAADEIRFAVTDIEGLEALQQEFGPF